MNLWDDHELACLAFGLADLGESIALFWLARSLVRKNVRRMLVFQRMGKVSGTRFHGSPYGNGDGLQAQYRA